MPMKERCKSEGKDFSQTSEGEEHGYKSQQQQAILIPWYGNYGLWKERWRGVIVKFPFLW